MSFTRIETAIPASAGATAGTSTATLGVAAAANNLLIATVNLNLLADLSTVTIPANYIFATAYLAARRVVGVYYKVAVGGEAEFIASSTDATELMVATLTRYSLSGTLDTVTSLSGLATNAPSMSLGPITTAVDSLLFSVFKHDGSNSVNVGGFSYDAETLAGDVISGGNNNAQIRLASKIATSTSETFVHTLSGNATRQSGVLVSFTEIAGGLNYTQRKGSTFDATHTLGTITTATLNAAAITINTTGAGTVNLTDTSGITTSGEYNLVLGDGAAIETYTVQLNVYGVVPSNNPAKKDGVALASLTNVQVRITSGTGLNGVQRFYSPTETTDASGNFSTLDLSSSVAADADPVLMHVLTAAGDSIISSETVGLI
jgi:hypothetical protein